MGEPPCEQFFVIMNTSVHFVMKSLCKGKLVPSVSWQWSYRSVDLGYLLKQEFPTDTKDTDIPRKNLVKQGSQAAKLVTNGQAFKFHHSKQLLISSPLFLCKKGLAHPDPSCG